ncbi:MAG TPA: cytochrome P450 [Caulobacterales bacterium]|nr:cytochrome P450 [Caulobacterales bacterium]
MKFDPMAPETLEHPGEAYSKLRAECPFHLYKGPDFKFAITSDYREIKEEILQDNPVWSFRFGNAAKDTISDVGFKTDPPFHMAFRAALAPGFTPKALAKYAADIDRISDDLIASMLALPEREGDFHDLFALPLPSRLMCVMLGAPEEDNLHYKRWADILQDLLFHDPKPGSFEPILKEIYPHFNAHLDARQAKLEAAGVAAPDASVLGTVLPDDFMSRTIIGKVEGRPLTREEQLNVCLAFLTGGQETTISLIANLVWRLLETPALWERLKREPELCENAIEESLRFDPPVLAHFRTSLCPTKMHGQELPERSKLMFSIVGANRDPAVFEDPQSFRIDRPLAETRKHLSFGAGVHFCMGAPVARLEAKTALPKLLKAFPNLRLNGETKRIGSWMHWGRVKLPVAWG